jgi:DNA-binding NarL/FixJ family response regulator
VADGLERLRMHEPPHCMLLDLGLPDGKGTRLLQHLRAKEMTTKVAIVTGAADQKLLKEAMKFEPDHVLKKPFGLQEIEQWLSTAVEMRRSIPQRFDANHFTRIESAQLGPGANPRPIHFRMEAGVFEK